MPKDIEQVPVENLKTLCGTVVGQQVVVLKDDGCNTNVMSTSFVNKNLHLVNIKGTSVTINHSNREVTEDVNEIVVDAEIQMGSHKYKSSWIVADCRFDVLLGMPWRVECQLM